MCLSPRVDCHADDFAIFFCCAQVTKLQFDYTDCDISAPTDGTSAPMPSGKYSCTYPWFYAGSVLAASELNPTCLYLLQTHFLLMTAVLDTMLLNGHSPTTQVVLSDSKLSVLLPLMYHMIWVSS